jgi:UDP-N-acetylglucosamine transferase subunit ALG13
MIFVTVGSLHPFDRLIQTVDRWVGERSHADIEVLAQIGAGSYQPRHCRFVSELPPSEYRRLFAEADFIVAHAGMGTIITAIELGKPTVVMPRRSAFQEHVNDHQIATVQRFQRSQLIRVAETPDDLLARLDEMLAARESKLETDTHALLPAAELLAYVRAFVTGELLPAPVARIKLHQPSEVPEYSLY